MAIVQTICLLITIKVNRFENNEKSKIIKIFEWIIPIITVLLYIIMLEVLLGSTVYVGKSVCMIGGIIFIIIGNYLPKISFEVGKKITHPVPQNEEIFRKMNKIMGYSFIIIGITLLILISIV